MGKQAGQLLEPAGSGPASKPSILSDSTPPVETFLGGCPSPGLGPWLGQQRVLDTGPWGPWMRGS